MRTILFFWIALFIANCSNQEVSIREVRQKGFNELEICYKKGWGGGFCFSIDSAGQYIAKKDWDTVYYGMMPETMLQSIDSVAAQIMPATRSKPFDCSDCSVIAVQVLRNSDSIRFVQEGMIDRFLLPLIEKLDSFGQHSLTQKRAQIKVFAMEDSVIPAPKIEDMRFRPPIN